MKYTLKLLGIACLTTFTFSCNKSGSKVGVADSLVGEWELRQTSAAMNPLVGNYPPGNGKIVKFTETRYSIYDGGQVVKQGEYRIVADPVRVLKPVCAWCFPPVSLPTGSFMTMIQQVKNSFFKLSTTG